VIRSGLGHLVTTEGIRWIPILGAAGRYRAGRADTGEMLVWLLIAGGTIAAVCVLLYVVNRLLHRWRYNSHPALFYGLCKVHGLDGNARRLLRQVARSHNLRWPGRLFVEPKWLEPANLGGTLRARAAELVALRERLFRRAKTADRGPNPPNPPSV